MSEVTLVFGLRGTGKTTWLMENLSFHEPFVLIDPLYDPKYGMVPLYRPGSLDELLRIFRHAKPRRLYLSPSLRAFDWICALVLARGNLTLIVDEVDYYTTSHTMPEYLSRIIRYGRHKNIGFIGASRRPMEVNKLIRTQASRFIIFPLGDEDLTELRSYLTPAAYQSASLLRWNLDSSEYLDYSFRDRKFTVSLQSMV